MIVFHYSKVRVLVNVRAKPTPSPKSFSFFLAPLGTALAFLLLQNVGPYRRDADTVCSLSSGRDAVAYPSTIFFFIVLNIKTVFKVVAGGITVASTLEILSRGSTYDQLGNGVNHCVLPAGTNLLQISEGCVCLTVQAEDLSALNSLWSLYQEGTLKERLQSFFVTDEITELAGGEELEVIVTIEEREYKKACVELTRKAQGIKLFSSCLKL